MEGSGVGSGGCVVHFDVHGSELCCGLLQCSCYTEHSRYMVPLCAETVQCMSSAGLYGMWSLSYAVKFYC